MKEQILDIQNEINSVLAQWNPLSVDQPIAVDEYKGYVPQILRVIRDDDNLTSYLEDLLVNKLGLEYDPNNEAHVKDLQSVCRKLRKVVNNTNC